MWVLQTLNMLKKRYAKTAFFNVIIQGIAVIKNK